MNSTTLASATTGINTGTPCLPGELFDAILDSITFDDDEKALDTLRACMLVSRAFRLRAMFILIAHLDFSAVYGRAHILKSLQLFELLRAAPDLCALPRSVILDMGEPGVLAARAMDILPTLPNLKQLTLSDLDTCDVPLPRWDISLEVEHLVLESCSLSTDELDVLLQAFPKLRKLELVRTQVSSMSDGEPQSADAPSALPFNACMLELSLPDPVTSMAVFNWAIIHRESFIELATLALAPTVVPVTLREEFLAVFGGDVTSLTLGLADSQHAADDEKATLDACNSVRTLSVLTPSLPRALVLFRSVRLTPPPHVQRVLISTCDKADPRIEEINALRDALKGWVALEHVLIDQTPLAFIEPEAASEPDIQGEDARSADTYASPFALDCCSVASMTDSALDILLVGPAIDDVDCDCDDETVGAPTPSLHIPEQYRDDNESDSESDELPAPRRDSYAPPFALGVSTTRYDDSDDESELDSDYSELNTPHDSDVELPDVVDAKRNPYTTPFVLGVSIACPSDEGGDEDVQADSNRPDPFKPPFALGVSTTSEELED